MEPPPESTTEEFDDLLVQFRAESLPKQITNVLFDYFVGTGSNGSNQSTLGSNFSLSQTIDHILDSSKLLSSDQDSEDPTLLKTNTDLLANFTSTFTEEHHNNHGDHLIIPNCFQSSINHGETPPVFSNQFNDNIQVRSRSIVNNLEDLPETLANCSEYYDEYFRDGCGCSKGCHRLFPKRMVFQAHLDALAMDRFCSDHVNHQHLLLLGAMNALVKNYSKTSNTRKRKDSSSSPSTSKDRINARTFFKFRGHDVCRNFFLYAFGCGIRRIKNVQKQFLSNGILPKQHESAGNVKRMIKLDSNRQRLNALIFIANYAEQNALQLPGRFVNGSSAPEVNDNGQHPSSIKHYDLYLLPKQLNLTRRNIYDLYVSACSELSHDPISFALWNELWSLKYPNIMTVNCRHREVCFECRQYRDYLLQATNNNFELSSKTKSISSKLVQTQRYLDHLNLIQNESIHYRHCLERSQHHYEGLMVKNDNIDGDNDINLRNRFISTLQSMHYTIDWYSTISLPICPTAGSGTIYFKSGYKVSMFGITIEPLKKFVLYLIPEFVCHNSQSIPNLTLSILEHFFENFHFNEKETVIHFANNSIEQSKQSLMFSYFMWRTLIGHHDKVEISFLPSGHSRCWNDLFMGAFKKKLRNCAINSLQEIKSIAERCTLLDGSTVTATGTHNNDQQQFGSLDNSGLAVLASGTSGLDNGTGIGSTPRGFIQPILVGNDQMELLLPLYDWETMFTAPTTTSGNSNSNNQIDQLNPEKVLSEYNHYEINIEIPGFILCRKSIDSEIISYKLLSSNQNLTLINQNRPPKLNLEPIPPERIQYLRDNLIQYLIDDSGSMGQLRDSNLIPLTSTTSANSTTTSTSILTHIRASGNIDSSSTSTFKRPSSFEDGSNWNKNKQKKKQSPSQPKCGYCKEVGHRETIFGKIRCPKKKKDCSILDSNPVISEDDHHHHHGNHQLTLDDQLCIVEEALLNSTDDNDNGNNDDVTSKTITFDSNGQLSIITSNDDDDGDNGDGGGVRVTVELPGDDNNHHHNNVLLDASSYFHKLTTTSQSSGTTTTTSNDDRTLIVGVVDEMDQEEEEEEVMEQNIDEEELEQHRQQHGDVSNSPYHLLVMPDIDL